MQRKYNTTEHSTIQHACTHTHTQTAFRLDNAQGMVLTEKLTFILACKQTCDPTEPMLQVGEGVGDIGEGVPVLFLFQLF